MATSYDRVEYEPGSDIDFARLYTESYNKILRMLILRLEDRAAAEDCAQESFVRAYRGWKTWKPIAPAEAWLCRIAVNTAISYQRKRRLREVVEQVRRLGPPKVLADPLDIAGRSELMEALAALSPKQSSALLLRHYHGYTNRTISEYLGIPERTFTSRLADAKLRLRFRLERSRAELSGDLPRSA